MESRFQCAICSQPVKDGSAYLCASCARTYDWDADWVQAMLDEEEARRVQWETQRTRLVDVNVVETDEGQADDIEDVLEYSAPRYRSSVEDQLRPRLSHQRLLTGGIDLTPYEQEALQDLRYEVDDSP